MGGYAYIYIYTLSHCKYASTHLLGTVHSKTRTQRKKHNPTIQGSINSSIGPPTYLYLPAYPSINRSKCLAIYLRVYPTTYPYTYHLPLSTYHTTKAPMDEWQCSSRHCHPKTRYLPIDISIIYIYISFLLIPSLLRKSKAILNLSVSIDLQIYLSICLSNHLPIYYLPILR